ncbi:MAG: hypothetical protein KDB27_09445 [Planctomycetales bacterium]|nr:hypothetical protein [Planctomycetales bacterium]
MNASNSRTAVRIMCSLFVLCSFWLWIESRNIESPRQPGDPPRYHNYKKRRRLGWPLEAVQIDSQYKYNFPDSDWTATRKVNPAAQIVNFIVYFVIAIGLSCCMAKLLDSRATIRTLGVFVLSAFGGNVVIRHSTMGEWTAAMLGTRIAVPLRDVSVQYQSFVHVGCIAVCFCTLHSALQLAIPTRSPKNAERSSS